MFTAGADGTISVEYEPAPPHESTKRLNIAGKVVDFGTVKTNGAFRLLKDERLVIPLPGSKAFDIKLDLAALGLPTKLEQVEALNEELEKQEEVAFAIEQGLLIFRTSPGVFAYRFVE